MFLMSKEIKYFLIQPVLFGMIVLFSFSNDMLSQTFDTNGAAQEDGIPFAIVNRVPLTAGCAEYTDSMQQKKCVSESIRIFVNRNFSKETISSYAKEGVNRIEVRFKIDTTGTVTEVLARSDSNSKIPEKEVIRVVSSMPKMIPGKHKEKTVSVLYSLPIVFNNESHSNN